MDYDSYMTLCRVSAAACIAFLLITVFLFFKLRIKSVIGDVSGLTAKKAIENIRNQNAQLKNKAHRSSPVNQARGRVTDRISQSGKVRRADTGGIYVNVGTEKMPRQTSSAEEGYDTEATTVLKALTNELPHDMPMQEISDETTVLASSGSFIEIEEDITFTHSDETIE